MFSCSFSLCALKNWLSLRISIFSDQIEAIYSVIETPLGCGKHRCVMGKAGKLSLSSNSSSDRSKRSKLQIDDAEIQFEDMVAPSRGMINANRNWQTVTKKHSNPSQKPNALTPATTMSRSRPKLSQSSPTGGV